MKSIPMVMIVFFLETGIMFAQNQISVQAVQNSGQSVESKIVLFTGQIVSVDAIAKVITVKTKSGKNQTMQCDEQTIIQKKDKILVLSDLKHGNKVKIEYLTINNKKIARLIKVLGKPIEKTSD